MALVLKVLGLGLDSADLVNIDLTHAVKRHFVSLSTTCNMFTSLLSYHQRQNENFVRSYMQVTEMKVDYDVNMFTFVCTLATFINFRLEV